MDYNANKLHQTILETMRKQIPKFQTLRIIVAGASGSGKSTVCGSFPVGEGKKRVIMDNEDSMVYIDAGEDGQDVYTPRKQRFAMDRMSMPTIWKYGELYQRIQSPNNNVGFLGIDNVSIFQDLIVNALVKGTTPSQNGDYSGLEDIKKLYKMFGIQKMPFDSIMKKWSYQTDPTFWATAKNIPKELILMAMRQNIDIVVTTEEANVWENYGSSNAKVVGKKAKIWDIWLKYFDMIIMLKRDPNTTNPPIGQINMLQPKMRIQGMNPSWKMDWQGFVDEVSAAMTRFEPEIPDEVKVKQVEEYDSVDIR